MREIQFEPGIKHFQMPVCDPEKITKLANEIINACPKPKGRLHLQAIHALRNQINDLNQHLAGHETASAELRPIVRELEKRLKALVKASDHIKEQVKTELLKSSSHHALSHLAGKIESAEDELKTEKSRLQRHVNLAARYKTDIAEWQEANGADYAALLEAEKLSDAAMVY